jgi:hypothetical protein
LSLFLYFFFTNSYAQNNTLDILGLSSSNQPNVAFSVRKLSSDYTGPLMRVRIGSTASSTLTYYDVYPDASSNGEISLNSEVSSAISSITPTISPKVLGSTLRSKLNSETEAYVGIWYDQSGNQNNLSNGYEVNQPKIISMTSIITANNKPVLYWWDVDIIDDNRYGRHVVYLQLGNSINTNGQVIIVNKFGPNITGTDGSDGFLLGDNLIPNILGGTGNYYWHSDPENFRLFGNAPSASITNAEIFQNGVNKGMSSSFNQQLAINSIAPQVANVGTGWDNIGNERGNNTGGSHFSTTGAGYSEILSFSDKLNSFSRSLVETNQNQYFSIYETISITAPIATLTSCLGTESTPTTFGVSGSGLTASVTISAPSNFEISTSSGGTYSSNLTLTNTSTVSQTLYVRLNSSASVGSKIGTITATTTGASATTSVSGTVNALPSISITETDASGVASNDAIICNGGSVTLTASGTTSFLWSSGAATTSSITITPSSSTTYTVTGTTSGCSNTASKTITVNSLPNIGISGTTTNPELVSLTATASEGSTYAWSDGSSTSSATNTFDASGVYSLTVTDTYGCISSTQLNITVQQYGLSRTGEKTLDSTRQINSNGQIGSLNPISQEGKKREYKSNKKVISDGLILNLDAGSSSSYPGIGTTWTDLTGNSNGTFVNFSTGFYSTNNGGEIIFDGVNDYVSLPTGTYFNGNFTIQSWIYPTGDAAVYFWARVLDFGNGAGSANVLLSTSGGGSGYPAMRVEGSLFNAITLLPLNQWSQLVATLSGTTAIIYLNGTAIGNATLTSASNTERRNNYIGKSNWGGDPYFKGKMSNLQIYNRALSIDEILKNYNALKSRFGL